MKNMRMNEPPRCASCFHWLITHREDGTCGKCGCGLPSAYTSYSKKCKTVTQHDTPTRRARLHDRLRRRQGWYMYWVNRYNLMLMRPPGVGWWSNPW